jgi:hypothetical protein
VATWAWTSHFDCSSTSFATLILDGVFETEMGLVGALAIVAQVGYVLSFKHLGVFSELSLEFVKVIEQGNVMNESLVCVVA